MAKVLFGQLLGHEMERASPWGPKAWRGSARHGWAGQGRARLGTAGPGAAWRGAAGHGKARQGLNQ